MFPVLPKIPKLQSFCFTVSILDTHALNTSTKVTHICCTSIPESRISYTGMFYMYI